MKNTNAEKKIVDKLVEEINENVDEVKLSMKMSVNLPANSTFCCFNNLYNQHWNWYVFYLLQINEP